MIFPITAPVAQPATNPIHLVFLEDGDGILVVLEEQAGVRPQMRWVHMFPDRTSACSRLLELGLLSPVHAATFGEPDPDGKFQWIELRIREPKRVLRDFHMSTMGAWS